MSSPNSPSRKSLHRYAHRFYMEHYRDRRFGATAREYCLSFIISGGAIVTLLFCLPSQISARNQLNVTILLALIVPLTLVFLHTAGKYIERRSGAKAFANQAICHAINHSEIEAYFDRTFPLVFYKK